MSAAMSAAMQMKKVHVHLRLLVLLVGLAAASAPCNVSAGTISSWTGGGVNGVWSSGSNWGVTPVPTGTNSLTPSSLIFSGTTRTTGTNDLGTVTVDSISFTNDGSIGRIGGFTLTGNTLALSTAAITTTATTAGSAITDTLSMAMTLGGSNTVTTGSGHNLLFSGNVSGNGSITYGGAGSVFLSGTNSYTGGTFITGGQVQTAASGALGGNVEVFGGAGASVTVSGSGVVLVRNSSTLSNNFTLSGTGDGQGTLRGSFSGAGSNLTATVSGTVTLAGDSQIRSTSGTTVTGNKFVLSGPVNLNANTLTLNPTIQGSIDISGKISGAGAVVLNGGNSGTSSVFISGSNDYTGGTTITSGTLRVGNASALGTGPLAVNTSGLDLNGQALSVAVLSGSSSGVIQSSVAGAASLTTTAATNSTYDGTIINGNGSAVVGLTKAGIGTLTLTGSNGYTGATNINGGALALGGANVLAGGGDIGFGGGTLQYSAVNTADYSARIKNSTGAIVIDTNNQSVTFASALAASNVGGLTKTGSGTLFLNAVNAYTGPTAVNAGTLAGNGTIAGGVTVSTGAVLAPGATAGSFGALTLGSLALNSGASTQLAISGTTAGSLYDQVAFTGGSKTMAYGGLLALTFSGTYADDTTFSLFSGFTSQSGNFSSITLSAGGSPYAGLTFSGPTGGVWETNKNENGQSLKFDQTTGVLAVVPEPSAWALAAIGTSLFGLGQWRRRAAARRRGA